MIGVRTLDAAEWDALPARFGERWDLVASRHYVELHAADDERAGCILAEDARGCFILPYLRHALHTVDGWGFASPPGYGGPFTTNDDPDFVHGCWQAIAGQWRAEGAVAGLLRLHPFAGNAALCPGGDVPQARPQQDLVVLDLRQKIGDIVAMYRKSTRKRIRRATASELQITTGQDASLLARFARLYAGRMDELAARSAYRYDTDYFHRLANWPTPCHVHLISTDGEDLGGTLVLDGPGCAYLHLSATTPHGRRRDAAHLARHQAIVAAQASGRCAWMIFGGGTSDDPRDSLLQFKRGFSSDLRKHHIATWVLDRQRHAAVCQAWRLAHPQLAERYGQWVDCYRITDMGKKTEN